MAWIRSEQSLGEHPKMKKAARLLGISWVGVVGHLHYLWWWCMDYAPDGDLSGYTVADVAEAARWEGRPDTFVTAMVECGRGGKPGFLERDEGDVLHVHDWGDFAQKLIEKREQDAARKRRERERKSSKEKEVTETSRGQSRGRHADVAGTVPNIPNDTVHTEAAAVDTPRYVDTSARAEDPPAAGSGGGLSSGEIPPDESTQVLHALQQAGILLPSAFEIEQIAAWLADGMDMGCIILACERAAGAGKRTTRYINGILRSWHAQGFRVRAQAEAENARAPTDQAPEAEPSFSGLLERTKQRKRGDPGGT